MRRDDYLDKMDLDERVLKALRAAIGTFFEEEHDLSLGMLGQDKCLRFALNLLGPIVHNRALNQAKRYYDERLNNIDMDYDLLYQDEDLRP